MIQRHTVYRLVRAAVIAALYVALCLLLEQHSYGAVQVRVSEALVLLVVLCPEAAWGVAVGCFFSNLVSYSPADLAIGPLATLLAALLSLEFANHRVGKTQSNPGFALLASVPPVVVNAVIIGAEVSIFFDEQFTLPGLFLNMLRIGAGQIISCCILGVGLVWVIEKVPRLHRLFTA